jgi:uncharacterized membrane protein
MSGIIMFIGAMLQVVQSLMFRSSVASGGAEAGAGDSEVDVTADVGTGFADSPGDMRQDLDALTQQIDAMLERMSEIERTAGSSKTAAE